MEQTTNDAVSEIIDGLAGEIVGETFDQTPLKKYIQYENKKLVFGLSKNKLFSFVMDYSKPLYVYDLGIIKDRVSLMKQHLGSTRVFYAVKANPHVEILRCLKSLGVGADVVSAGEIRRAIEAGFTGKDIVFSGVGKIKEEINYALDCDVYQINVESFPELKRISELAGLKNKCASVALRINPNIKIETHPYIATGLLENKFGIDHSQVEECLNFIEADGGRSLCLKGVSLHLGSQMLEFSGFESALKLMKSLYIEIKKRFPTVNVFDFGGGLGVLYEQQDLKKEEQLLKKYADVVKNELLDLVQNWDCELQTEPGRWIMAHAGVLIAQCQYIKETPHKTFMILDSGMNHLMRPALYQAYHTVLPLAEHKSRSEVEYDIVGPICESSDSFGKNRVMTEVKPEEFVVICGAGAYGYSMANTYKLHELPQEIIIA